SAPGISPWDCTRPATRQLAIGSSSSTRSTAAVSAVPTGRAPRRRRTSTGILFRGVRPSADGDRRSVCGRLGIDAHLLGDAQCLLDQGLDDLGLRHGLDHLALDEDLALAVARGDAEVGLTG